MAETSTICDFAGHDWEDMGGGMQICSECLTEREADRVSATAELMAMAGQPIEPERLRLLREHGRREHVGAQKPECPACRKFPESRR